ncbi:HeH/LEM domain-containing protein [Pantoea piersonii]|uniref:HeH/LEM domain-containing protein n=1 Tax=Pantoea piersonii TaxID=2364647 RepID=UPI0028A0E9AE|nr:HeH/LEM domain-containing protein [Pantoea piersonii]
MTVAKDHYVDPNDKARWGFAGSDGEIKVGPQTVGETGGVDHVRNEPKDEGAVNTGGGDSLDNKQIASQDGVPSEPAPEELQAEDINSLTVAQLKERLDAKGIEYKTTDAKADLVAALKAAE